MLARVYLWEGRINLAREVLEPALELADHDPTVLSLLGVLDLPIQALGLSDDPYNSARDRLIGGEIGQALAAARSAVSAHRDDPRATNLLGLSQLASAQYPAAVELFTQALVKAPDNMHYRLNLARAHLGNSAPDEGLKVLHGTKITGRAADVSVLRRALVISLDKSNNALGQPDPQPLFRWLIENPDDSGARLLMAETYIEKEAFSAAIAQYEILLAHGSDDPVLYNNLAWSYLQLGDNRARAHAEYAYELEPNDGTIADTLGWILASTGDVEKGALLLRDAHILRPGDPEIAYHLAYALSRIGAEDEAEALLDAIVGLGRVDVQKAARDLLSDLRESK